MYKLIIRKWNCFDIPEEKIETYSTREEAEKKGKISGEQYFIEEDNSMEDAKQHLMKARQEIKNILNKYNCTIEATDYGIWLDDNKTNKILSL